MKKFLLWSVVVVILLAVSFITFDPDRRVPYGLNPYKNTYLFANLWQWEYEADTNVIHLYDSSGNYLPGYDEAVGSAHANLAAMYQIPVPTNSMPIKVAIIDQFFTSDHGYMVSSLVDDCEVLEIDSTLESSQVATQIQFAVAWGARVVNMSFGYVDASPPSPVILAMREATNVLFCIAALNGNGPEDNSRDWLAITNIPNRITITGFSHGGELFGAYGTNCFISAPGRRIVVDKPTTALAPAFAKSIGGNYGELRELCFASGTSFATPEVATVVARLMRRYPAENVSNTIARLAWGADKTPYWVGKTLHGSLNAGRCFDRLTICKDGLKVEGPPGSITPVFSSEDLSTWLPFTTITNTGGPVSIPIVQDGMKFFRL